MKGKIKKLECPSCGANLTRKFFVGKYKCNYCGTIYTSQNQSTIKIDFTKIYKFIGVIAALFVLMLLIITQDDADKKTGKKTKTTYKTNISYETDNSKPKALDYPESEYMKIVLSKIFGKPYEEVTKEEIDSITYLNIETEWGMYGRGDNKNIIYSFEDYHDYDTFTEFEDNLMCVSISEAELENQKYSHKDFTCFKGLMYCPILYISDVLEYEGGFPKLTAIETSGYKRDMDTLKEICNTQKIDMLFVDAGFLTSDVDTTYSWLKDFKDLRILNISMCDSSEFPAQIGELTKLTELTIERADNIKELSVLKKLTNLKSLKIEDSRSLKNIDFIEGLALKVLELECYELKDFSALKDNDTIERLKIVNSYNNASFAPIATMKNVKVLDVDASDFTDYEMIGRLASVEKLYLSVFDSNRSLNFLRNMTKLKEAEFYGCDFDLSLYELEEAKELRKVLFSGTGANYVTVSLDKLPALEDLSLVVPDYSIIFLDEILINDKIKKLTIKDGELWFYKEPVTNNMKLEELVISNIKPIDKEYKEIEFDKYFKEICNISTLKSLTIKDSNLSDISGISKLENLEKLDISGNYVTDVSELKKLKKLKIADFSDNAISGAYSQ